MDFSPPPDFSPALHYLTIFRADQKIENRQDALAVLKDALDVLKTGILGVLVAETLGQHLGREVNVLAEEICGVAAEEETKEESSLPLWGLVVGVGFWPTAHPIARLGWSHVMTPKPTYHSPDPSVKQQVGVAGSASSPGAADGSGHSPLS